MNNEVLETVGNEVMKAAGKTLTTGQLILGGIGCFLGGVATTIGGFFVGKKLRNRKPKKGQAETKVETKEAETKAE